ncbi:MAG: hypothetical protein GY696_38090 [Gammaproteobacteria bacterium]|nr:hypothetical protein [Gammaproteobacteria bacterium]
MSCARHFTATVHAHKQLECYFHTRGRQVLRILGLVDTGIQYLDLRPYLQI